MRKITTSDPNKLDILYEYDSSGVCDDSDDAVNGIIERVKKFDNSYANELRAYKAMIRSLFL